VTESVFAYPGMGRELSNQSIFDYLFFHVCPGPGTIYEGVSRLPAGHCIEFSERAASDPRPYWSMHFDEARGASKASLKDDFVRLLQGAVADARGDANCGAFLSGGTDSSTVAGMLARTHAAPTEVFSIGFDVPGYDEMEYAHIAAKHFGCHHNKYYVTP